MRALLPHSSLASKEIMAKQTEDEFFETCLPKLLEIIKYQLRGINPGHFDEQDIAQTVMRTLLRMIREGSNNVPEEGKEMLRFLTGIARHKLSDRQRKHFSKKNNEGKLIQGSALASGAEARTIGLDEIGITDISQSETARQIVDDLEELLTKLDRNDLKLLVQWALEGLTQKEMAERLGCALRTIEKKWQLIKTIAVKHLSE